MLRIEQQDKHLILKLKWTNKCIPFSSYNRELARCMLRLISFVIALSSYEARKESEIYKMKKKILPTVGLEPNASRLLDWRSNQLRNETT